MSLRPAACAVVAYVILDGARVVGLPGWLDVVAFCVMPACWMGLLRVERVGGIIQRVEHAAHDVTVRGTRVDGFGDEAQQERGEHARILPRFAPALSCLLYSLLLLSLRHEPTVLAHWTGLLQAPRVAGFGLAAWVGLRSRRAPRDPSRDVGLVLALGAGVAVAAGLWPTWGDVRAVSLASWILVAGIVVAARPTR